MRLPDCILSIQNLSGSAERDPVCRVLNHITAVFLEYLVRPMTLFGDPPSSPLGTIEITQAAMCNVLSDWSFLTQLDEDRMPSLP